MRKRFDDDYYNAVEELERQEKRGDITIAEHLHALRKLKRPRNLKEARQQARDQKTSKA